MQFMIMHKITDEMESGETDPEVVEGVGRLIAESAQKCPFLAGEGLKPTAERTRLSYKRGERTRTEGPFPSATQLPAGYALLRVGSKDEALVWCDKFAEAIGDVDLYLGPVVEPWDLGMMAKPENPPLRFLCMHEADHASEKDTPPSEQEIAKMMGLIDQMTQAGVLEATGGLLSTKHGARVHFDGDNHRVIDGPFAESKELVAGYAIYDLPSIEVAIDWAVQFGKVVKVNEVDIRQVAH